MYNKILLMIEDNEAIKDCRKNLNLSIIDHHSNFDTDELTYEENALEPLFKLMITTQQESNMLGIYDINMSDLERFAKRILNEIELIKYYKSSILEERKKKGYCL